MMPIAIDSSLRSQEERCCAAHLCLPDKPSPEELQPHQEFISPELAVIAICNLVPGPSRCTILSPAGQSQPHTIMPSAHVRCSCQANACRDVQVPSVSDTDVAGFQGHLTSGC